jgi:hypothetical protein
MRGNRSEPLFLAGNGDVMISDGELADVAGIIAGFGSAMLFFRISRELEMSGRGEVKWIPWADRLLIAATLVSLLLVVFPVVCCRSRPDVLARLPAAGCAATSIMVSGYVFGILAHYRLIFGSGRSGERDNPEPSERVIVILATLLSIAVFLAVLVDAT